MIELKDFDGKVMQLQGVDESHLSVEKWGSFEDASLIRFKLDGVVYVAIEDPSDGYRSYLGELKVDDTDITNPFSGVEVIGVYKTGSEGRSCDILDLVDTTTKEVVLSVGTDDDDDYYPCFVSHFQPRNMSVNSGK